MSKGKEKQRHINAFEKGYTAAKTSYHSSANPYPLRSIMRERWAAGFSKYKDKNKQK